MKGVTPFPLRMIGGKTSDSAAGSCNRECRWGTGTVEGKLSHACESPSGIHGQARLGPVMYGRARLGYMARRKKAQSCIRECVWDTWPEEKKASHVWESPSGIHNQLKKGQVMYTGALLGYMTS
jgi:hypothetical protein